MQPMIISLIIKSSGHPALFPLHDYWKQACIATTDPHVLRVGRDHWPPVTVQGIKFDTRTRAFVRALSEVKEGDIGTLRLPTFQRKKPKGYQWSHVKLFYYRLSDPAGQQTDRAGIHWPITHRLLPTGATPLAPTDKSYGKMRAYAVELTATGDPYVAITTQPRASLVTAVREAREFVLCRNELLDQVADTPLIDYV